MRSLMAVLQVGAATLPFSFQKTGTNKFQFDISGRKCMVFSGMIRFLGRISNFDKQRLKTLLHGYSAFVFLCRFFETVGS